jgi:predicted ATPase
MDILFTIVSRVEPPVASKRQSVQLVADNWDDFKFVTSFDVVFFSSDGHRSDLGTVKIGYVGQKRGATKDAIVAPFTQLPTGWFSVGQDVAYYRNIHDTLPPEIRAYFLRALGDVAADNSLFVTAQNEPVFGTSLMRTVSLSAIRGQYRRVLDGQPALTEFRFSYRDPGDASTAAIDLRFEVKPDSKPLSNVHVLIGRNGVGKTTLLNNMVGAIVNQEKSPASKGVFYAIELFDQMVVLPLDYFSSIVSVSFSAFDPFVPPPDQPDRSRGVAYFYVGLKKSRSGDATAAPQPPKTEADLANDFVYSLVSCFSQQAKRDRWQAAMKCLESDSNFADMFLGRLLDIKNDDPELEAKARTLLGRMSSGHAIVLLTVTKLVDTVEEKTLVLMDEPESHLHPPLLSAFTRALSDLLHNRNGVAIIATHSPVVVQEVPRSCVWKLTRLRTEGRSDRPERETFGENIGALTKEIFGLEVSKSGFHDVLQSAVDGGGTFDSIFEEYREQLGIEAQAIVRVLIAARDVDRMPAQ